MKEQFHYTPNISTWLNPSIEYLFDVNLYEYDMHNAGMSIIRELRLLPKKQIDELMAMDKKLQTISIGKLQKDKSFSVALMQGFEEMRTRFLLANRLEDNDIVSVKKDAFFVTTECQERTFGVVEFAQKNRYTSYIRLSMNHNIELYYSKHGIDIKGMSDISVNKHRPYMLEFLNDYFRLMESRSRGIKRFLKEFFEKYRTGELDDGYYIEFNSASSNFDPMYNRVNLIVPLINIVIAEGV